jgi:hypothetical protein
MSEQDVLLQGYKSENEDLLRRIATLALQNKALETRLKESFDAKFISELKTRNENLTRTNGILKAELDLKDGMLALVSAYFDKPWIRRVLGGTKEIRTTLRI